jgi:hypothetical protein
MYDFLSDHQIVVINAYSNDIGAQTMDAISLENYGRVTFLFNAGSTAGDTSTVTVLADSGTSTTAFDVSGGTAMAFKYRTCAWAASPATADTWSSLTDATSSGIALTATTYKSWAIEVTAADAQAALAGAKTVYLAFADAGSATYGNVLAILSEPRYPGAVPKTAIA